MLRLLGGGMVGLRVTIGLIFPAFMDIVGIATPDSAGSIRSRVACLVAGVLLAGLNYVLARFVVGRRLERLTGQMRKVNGVVRLATTTGDWSALHVHDCLVRVDPNDEIGEATRTLNTLVDTLDENAAERKRLEGRLHHQAFHDPLTGLPNRLLFLDRVEHALSRTRRDLSEIAILFVDLDGFKDVNDTAGHAAGDSVLLEASRRIASTRRAGDTVARFGGDEFVVLVEDVDRSEASRIAEELCAQMRTPVVLGARQFQRGASIGISYGNALTNDPESLLRGADLAMYLAKRAGRDCSRTFTHPDNAVGLDPADV